MTPRRRLYEVIGKIADALAEQGIHLPDALKRRDPREPNRAEKEEFEDRLEKLILNYFAAQEEQLRTYLSQFSGGIQDVDAFVASIPASVFDSPEAKAALIALLLEAAAAGVALSALDQAGSLVIDWTLADAAVADSVNDYSSKWFDQLDETTKKKLRAALRLFVTQPGFTIGDVMNALPFGGVRAHNAAIGTVTTMYGAAAQKAGEELQKAYPYAVVLKTWFTNRDEKVCPICKPLDQMTVRINEFFTTEEDKSIGVPYPGDDVHPGDRCWIRIRLVLKRDYL